MYMFIQTSARGAWGTAPALEGRGSDSIVNTNDDNTITRNSVYSYVL